MRRKYTQEEVSKVFSDNGCELLSEYKDARTPVEYKCICGNKSAISLDNFKRGRRCKECGLKKLADTFRHDIDYVKSVFIENGCVPLFDEYISTHTPLKYICNCGNTSHIAFADFQSGKRCDACRVQRIQLTMYKNGTQMCSAQQEYLHNILKGELNYPVNSSSLDIAFPDEKFYIEYDGSGHDLSVKLKSMTLEQFKKKEKNRRYALYKLGWNEIRIVSKKDKLPTKNKILEMFLYAKNYFLTGHSWIIFDIDNNKVLTSQFEQVYNFGKVKRVA